MKRVSVSAYLRNNLGDDLMMEILLNRYPQHRFYVDSDIPETAMFQKYPNFANKTTVDNKLHKANYWLNKTLLRTKKNYLLNKTYQINTKYSDCSVYIGGSLFMEISKHSKDTYLKRLAERLPAKNKFVIGANFGPFSTDSYFSAHEDFFRLCNSVCFRDRKSYNLFKHLPNVAYAPDVVLNLDITSYTTEQDNTIIISVINMRTREQLSEYADDYECFLARACQYWVNHNKKPVLMSFCFYEGDEKGIQLVLEKLPEEIRRKVDTYFYKGDTREALTIFAKAEFVIATRFHSMILALLFHKPFFSISYNEKIRQVLEDLCCEAFCEVYEIQKLKIDEIQSMYKPCINIDEYIRGARNQFKRLDAYLK